MTPETRARCNADPSDHEVKKKKITKKKKKKKK
jgi:hypothetical protein